VDLGWLGWQDARWFGMVGGQGRWRGCLYLLTMYSISSGEKSRGRSSANLLYLLRHQFRAENILCLFWVQYPVRLVSECWPFEVSVSVKIERKEVTSREKKPIKSIQSKQG
jgi:hypothetical protein